MKKQTLFSILFLLAMLVLGSCNSGSVLTRATGFAYEVVVVMDQANWESEEGKAVKSQLTAPIPGLPQAEPSLKVTYSRPSDFNGLMTYVRNILIVDINKDIYTKVTLAYEANRWAQGQYVMTLKAPDSNAIVEYLNKRPTVLTDFFVKIEMNRAVEQLQESYSSVVMDNLKSKYNLMLNAPENMTFYKDTTDFFWASNNANTGRTDLIVYTFPYTDKDTFTPEYLVAKRDSVLKVNLPGSFPGTYMATETRFGLGVDYKAITVNNKYCGVMRGLWRVVGDMMGGPFVSHIRLDEENNRVVVAEGFVYAPETDKGNFIRRIEAALFTLKLPGEFEQEYDSSLDVSQEE